MSITVDIIIALVAAALIFLCAKRGLIKSVIHFAKTILAFVLAYFFGSVAGQWICEAFVSKPVYDSIYEKINEIYQSSAGGMDAQTVMDQLPSFILTDDVKAKLQSAEGAGEDLIASMTESVATPLAETISNILGYVLVFIVAFVGLWVLAVVLSKLSESIVILKTANTVLGALLGALVAFMVLSVICSLLKTFFWNTDFYQNAVLVRFFGDSGVLNALKFLDLSSLMG